MRIPAKMCGEQMLGYDSLRSANTSLLFTNEPRTVTLVEVSWQDEFVGSLKAIARSARAVGIEVEHG